MDNICKQHEYFQPVIYPTQLQFPTRPIFLSLKEIDEEISMLSLDLYAMFQMVLQIRNCIMHLTCSVQYFQKYGIRLMRLINSIFANFGIDRHHFAKLIGCLRFCNGHWKKILLQKAGHLAITPDTYTSFLFKIHRNIYIFMMLRANNTIILKLVKNMQNFKQLTPKHIKYLKNNGLNRLFDGIYLKMVQILQEKEEETEFKIILINEFIKFLLQYLNFCSCKKDFKQVFDKFFCLVQYLCRILRKFSAPSIQKLTQESLLTIKQGFNYYINVLQQQQNSNTRIEQILHMICIIQQVSGHHVLTQNINQHAFVIRLVHKILKKWKVLHLKAERQRTKQITRSTQQLSITLMVRKQKENRVKEKAQAGKIEQAKAEFLRINKSRSHLQRRRSQSFKPVMVNLPKQGMLTMQPPNSIKIRKEIQGNISQYFEKLDYMKLSRSFSKDYKKSMAKKDIQEKEMRLEEYSEYYNSRKRVVPNLNHIRLYKPQKMKNYCKKEPKLKIQPPLNIS